MQNQTKYFEEVFNESHYRDIANQMIQDILETEKLPWEKSWADCLSPINWITKRPYSGFNAWLLSFVQRIRGYKSRCWAGYVQMNKKGGRIEKGEKGVPIFVPHIEKISQKVYNPFSGQIQEYELSHVTYQRRYVWNLEQCCIPESYNPRLPTQIIHNEICSAQEIVHSYAHSPTIFHNSSHCCYSPNFDFIEMPDISEFQSAEAYYSTLFHEMIHSTGHNSRLRRFSSNWIDRVEYSKEELVAEFGSCFLSAKAGILYQNRSNQIAYLQNWVSYLSNHKSELLLASLQALNAVNHILGTSKPQQVDQGTEIGTSEKTLRTNQKKMAMKSI